MKFQEVFNSKSIYLKRVRFERLCPGDIFLADPPDDGLPVVHVLFFMKLDRGWEFESSPEEAVASDGKPNYFSPGMFVLKIIKMDKRVLELLEWIQKELIDKAIDEFKSLEEGESRSEDSNIIDLSQIRRKLKEIKESVGDEELSGEIESIIDYIGKIPSFGSAAENDFQWLKENIGRLIG